MLKRRIRAQLRLYTVIFYIDGDRAVETFVERVKARSASDAWEKAKKQALKSGGSSSGYPLGAHDFENATEIATFDGHLEQSSYA